MQGCGLALMAAGAYATLRRFCAKHHGLLSDVLQRRWGCYEMVLVGLA